MRTPQNKTEAPRHPKARVFWFSKAQSPPKITQKIIKSLFIIIIIFPFVQLPKAF